MYIYYALINTLIAHMIHINLNMIFTCRAQSYQNNLHKVLYGKTNTAGPRTTHTHSLTHSLTLSLSLSLSLTHSLARASEWGNRHSCEKQFRNSYVKNLNGRSERTSPLTVASRLSLVTGRTEHCH